MKKILILTVTLSFMLVYLTEAQAWFWDKKKEEPTPIQKGAPEVKDTQKTPQGKKEPEKKIDKAQEEAIKAQRALIEKKREELNNTEWSIEINLISGKGKKVSDILVFKDKQITVESYNKRGFPYTSYSLSIQRDGTVVWETMQTSEKSGVVFWRGELDPNMENMRGVFSHQIDANNKEDYSFISTSKKKIPITKG
jgi:hypothetical protein